MDQLIQPVETPLGYRDNVERASMDVGISKNNIGYQMLLKMGWKEATPLGTSGEGLIEPIKLEVKADVMGLGRKERNENLELPEMQRKKLEIEIEETQEIKQKRLDRKFREDTLQNDLLARTEGFYCELCDKRYEKIQQYEYHLDSLDHNHTKRLKDLRKNAKIVPEETPEQKLMKSKQALSSMMSKASALQQQEPSVEDTKVELPVDDTPVAFSMGPSTRNKRKRKGYTKQKRPAKIAKKTGLFSI
eukprot:TRINITY_DN3836_c0_g1_i8.p1 TRINITY_DN3836_c0_g1~~TRINITY_DN3836_c0_g1_i8.p1  ORF type:complete len:247 (+),score=68.56 TRINITY_DN3836_c0_g1_i8:145-885(+)